MATFEQIIYGFDPAQAQKGRHVLARSPGITKDCAVEVVKLCKDWGSLTVPGGFRPVLLSFPLENRLHALPGRLFAVISITDGINRSSGEGERLFDEPEDLPTPTPTPLFHAVVIGETDYASFSLNPFALALEDVFLDQWAPVRATRRATVLLAHRTTGEPAAVSVRFGRGRVVTVGAASFLQWNAHFCRRLLDHLAAGRPRRRQPT